VGHRVGPVFADHCSLLQTIEENLGLPLLGNADDTVQISKPDQKWQPGRVV